MHFNIFSYKKKYLRKITIVIILIYVHIDIDREIYE